MSGDQLDLDAIERVMECRTRYQEIQPTGTIDPVCSEHGWLWPEGRAHCNKWSDERIALIAEVHRLRGELESLTESTADALTEAYERGYADAESDAA